MFIIQQSIAGFKNTPPILYQICKKKNKKAYYKWRIDETYIKVKGKWCYLYRAIDADGHPLDILLRKKRNQSSAYSFIKRLIKQFGKPKVIITDQEPSIKVVMSKIIKEFKLNQNCHCMSKYPNNLIEQDHRHIKVRNTKYESINTAKKTLKGIECIYGLYKKNHRSLQIYGFSPCHEIKLMLVS